MKQKRWLSLLLDRERDGGTGELYYCVGEATVMQVIKFGLVVLAVTGSLLYGWLILDVHSMHQMQHWLQPC